jgi:hypothetical protein
MPKHQKYRVPLIMIERSPAMVGWTKSMPGHSPIGNPSSFPLHLLPHSAATWEKKKRVGAGDGGAAATVPPVSPLTGERVHPRVSAPSSSGFHGGALRWLPERTRRRWVSTSGGSSRGPFPEHLVYDSGGSSMVAATTTCAAASLAWSEAAKRRWPPRTPLPRTLGGWIQWWLGR